jgi:SPP1 family predicted phage head-tail adaptor
MQSGKLRHRIQLLRPVQSGRDSFGGVQRRLQLIDKVSAAIEPLGPREVEIARGFSAAVSHKIRIRYRGDLDSRCVIVLDNRTFAINGVVDPEGRKRESIIYCTEVTS